MREEKKSACGLDIEDEIIIDLERSKYPNIGHNNNELIQQEAISSLCEHMANIVSDYNDNGGKKRYKPEYKCVDEHNKKEKLKLEYSDFIEYAHFRRKHETIALLGERGSGKSNFLVNMKDMLGEENFAYLKILDPTLFEDRQNILVAIISMIKDIVIDAGSSDSVVKKEKCYDLLRVAWDKTLLRLAEGLNLIDEGIGSNPMKKDIWDDERLVLQKGLKASKSGYGFEKQFHIFISYSLQMIGKSALILRLDDIDTNPEKGWNVLEVIRKYLTTPHLQVVISGDWELYSKTVRLKQWDNFKDLIDLDNNYEKQKKSIDNLEEQYFTKILQPTNRIYLRTLRSLDEKNNFSILVKNKNKNETNIEKYLKQNKSEKNQEATIKNIYKAIFKDTFSLSDNLVDNSCSMMMTLPLRTNLEVLRAFESSIYYEKTQFLINKKDFMDEFSNVFLTILDRFEFSHRDFQKLFESSGYAFLADKMYEFSRKHEELTFEQMVNPSVALRDYRINLFLLFVYGYTAQSMNKNISLIFDWHYSIRIFSKLLDQYRDSDDDFKAVRAYLDHGKKISIYKTTIKLSGLLIGTSHNSGDNIQSIRNELHGFAYLYSLERQNKVEFPYLALDTIMKKIEYKEYTGSKEKNTFIKLLLSIVLKGVSNKAGKEIQVLVSAHYIFGFLSNILNNDHVSSLPKKMSYLNVLKQYGDRENTNSRIAYGSSIYSGEDFKNYYSDKSSSLRKFIEKLEEWKKYIKNDKIIDFTLVQIDEAWEDFEYSELNMNHVPSAGQYLELQIFIFLNALLRSSIFDDHIISLEPISNYGNARKSFISNTIKYYNTNGKNDFKHNITDLKNIIEYVKKKEKINIFEFYLICPLWEYFINFEELNIDTLGGKHLFSEPTKVIMGDNNFYSSIFQELVIRTTDEVIKEIHQKVKSSSKTHKEIIEENFENIDDENLYKSLYALMVSIKDVLGYKSITKPRVFKWIDIYNEIKKERKK